MSILKIINGAESWSKEPPATQAAIDECSKSLGLCFPEQYVEFLLATNGAEGFTPAEHKAGYFKLYPTDRLVERNQGLEVQNKHPGYLAIGSNGAGELFLINTQSDEQPVLMVPDIDDDMKHAWTVGKSFEDFLEGVSKK